MQFKKIKRATAALLILGISTTAIGIDLAVAKPPKPTKKEIKAAKAEEAVKAEAASKAAAKLTSATKTLKQLTAIANTAQAAYNVALNELAIARSKAATQSGNWIQKPIRLFYLALFDPYYSNYTLQNKYLLR